jgi:hypothetical protein
MSFTPYNKDNVGTAFNEDVKINWQFPTQQELNEVHERLDALVDETRGELSED